MNSSVFRVNTVHKRLLLQNGQAAFQTNQFQVALVSYLEASKHSLPLELKDLIHACLNSTIIPSPIDFRGPVLDSNTLITAKWVIAVLIPTFNRFTETNLEVRSAYTILIRAMECFQKEDTLVDISIGPGEKLTVCGDIHGQFDSLIAIFEENGYPSETHKYIFNGDIVDRGSKSVECLLTLLAFKIALPKNFFINRGNHEDKTLNKKLGFYEESCRKYSQEFYSAANLVMEYMPIAHLIEKKVFVVHGGLPRRPDFMINELRGRFRVHQIARDGLIFDMLWSDPHDGLGVTSNRIRGKDMIEFGCDITEAFIQRNNLQCLIRSHQIVPNGCKIQHHGKCITVHSAIYKDQ